MLALPVEASAEPTPSEAPTAEAAPSGSPSPESVPAPAEQPAATEAEPAKPQPPKVVINIDKSIQEMSVFVDGVETHTWPVSTGLLGYSTPSGNYTPTSMNEMWYSRQWDDAPMPHSIFFTKQGHAIHGSSEVKKLGQAASHGCVRLAPENAKTLFKLVKATGKENVQVVLAGVTPGGEAKIAAPAKQPKPRAYDPWFEQPYAYEKPRRRGLFGRRWRNENAQRAPRYYQPRGVAPWGY